MNLSSKYNKKRKMYKPMIEIEQLQGEVWLFIFCLGSMNGTNKLPNKTKCLFHNLMLKTLFHFGWDNTNFIYFLSQWRVKRSGLAKKEKRQDLTKNYSCCGWGNNWTIASDIQKNWTSEFTWVLKITRGLVINLIMHLRVGRSFKRSINAKSTLCFWLDLVGRNTAAPYKKNN